MRFKLICVQTFFEHWSKYSGYHQFLSHLGGEFEIEHIRIKRQALPENKSILSKYTYKLLRKRFINSWSFEDDVHAEFKLINTVIKSLAQGYHVIVHFMDGEIGYNLFYFFRKLLQWNKHLKVMATYHQPPGILKSAVKYKAKIFSLDKVFIVGNSQRSFFSMYPRENLHFVPHGIDTEFFKPKPKKESSEKTFCVTVGIWLRDYDILERIILNAPQNFVFRIVSGQENTARFSASPNVELFSGIEDLKLLELYQSSDIGLLPLTESTANNSLLEMLACGLAVITNDVGSVTDYINDETGIVIPDSDHDKFLKALIEIDRNENSKIKFSKNARKRALQLNLHRTAQKMRSRYLEGWILGSKSFP